MKPSTVTVKSSRKKVKKICAADKILPEDCLLTISGDGY